ncbi:MerR family transcriptional regulator [Limosilactobacillus reuteri]|uniref:MerR family transcriptional regulator n=1 Tax=Limosilactobacillus reuteri TaxID=1598 RepID=UPI001E5908F7|nr:MerR family transcriptional regulator [Limosilactobacillus reuteri]MCC4400191.1 MerR family transcriptional regulator [Limosilactobacillus reuteri]MCC4403607.1 MerR family transcriptional regulator [Limosilactobacillus reuteri]
MNIKEASERLNIPKETLRYWENSGLIPEVPRNSSGYRDYTENEIKWALFIKAMRNAGMSVDSLIEFINLYNEHKSSREVQKSLVKEQYDILLAKRNELDKTLNYLSYKLDHFEDHVIPFLEEENYYELRKDKMLDDKSETK